MRIVARVNMPLLAALVIAACLVPDAAGKPKPVDPPGWYVILGKTQLLDGAKAFPAFCRKQEKTARSALRTEVVARLKKIAAAEQPKIRAALRELGCAEGHADAGGG